MADFFDIVDYRGLYDTTPIGSRRLLWTGLLDLFSRHIVTSTKDRAPGFGPYSTFPVDPEHVCPLHEKPKRGPHRCDRFVDRLSLAVFDADMGTEAAVLETERRLVEAGLTYALYSSFSYPAKVSYRLVLPLHEPIEPVRWGPLRGVLKQRFALPVDLKKCGGASHFYYLPACPPGVTPVFRHHAGKALNANDFVPPAFVVRRHLDFAASDPGPVVEEETGPIDLSGPRAQLQDKIRGLRARQDVSAHERATVLQAVLDGRPLAQAGSRNDTLASTAFWLVHQLDATNAQVIALLTPSLIAMQREGSRTTSSELKAMVRSSRAKKDDLDRAYEAIRALFRSDHEKARQQVGRVVVED